MARQKTASFFSFQGDDGGAVTPLSFRGQMEARDLLFMTLQRVFDDLSKGTGPFAMDDGECIPALEKGLIEIAAHAGFGFIAAESSHVEDKS